LQARQRGQGTKKSLQIRNLLLITTIVRPLMDAVRGCNHPIE
jgi:hypothetical protein